MRVMVLHVFDPSRDRKIGRSLMFEGLFYIECCTITMAKKINKKKKRKKEMIREQIHVKLMMWITSMRRWGMFYFYLKSEYTVTFSIPETKIPLGSFEGARLDPAPSRLGMVPFFC